MGTSKSYGGMKGTPTWSTLSSTITKAVNGGHPTKQSLGNVMSHTVAHLGGSHGASSGSSNTGGSAGVRAAQRFGSFIGSAQSSGFGSALAQLADGVEVKDADEAINLILEHCAENAGTLDEIAAKAAMRELLEEILVKYFGNYLYQHLCTDFYEKLIKEKGIRETDNFYKDLKDYIVEKTKTISKHRDLSKVDWNSEYGKKLMQDIFRDTLKAFEDYEG